MKTQTTAVFYKKPAPKLQHNYSILPETRDPSTPKKWFLLIYWNQAYLTGHTLLSKRKFSTMIK